MLPFCAASQAIAPCTPILAFSMAHGNNFRFLVFALGMGEQRRIPNTIAMDAHEHPRSAVAFESLYRLESESRAATLV